VQRYEINQRMSEDMRKWQVDLRSSFGTAGVAGPQSYITDPITGQQVILIDPNLVGGIGNAYKLLFTGGYTNWGVSFNVVIPLRNRTVDAQLAQIKIGKRQQLMRRKSTEQQIQTEIRNAVQKIETNRKQVDTAKVSLDFSREQLTGEEKRFEAGFSYNFLVIQRQNELSAAQNTELQALISYKKSIIALQKAMNTLLESSDFEIAKTSSDNVPSLK
jgi:outer membrane protein TolC